VDYDEQGEDRVLAAALFRQSGVDFAQALELVRALDQDGRTRLAQSILGSLGDHDVPPELEYSATFD
jgi:hypothetical protein